MKKPCVLAFSVVLATLLFAFVGCAQSESPGGGTKNMTGSAQVLSNDTRVSVIDVGKGDCILIQSGDSFGLIDSGYDDTSSDVVSYLRNQGVSHLDFLIITHYDKDHIGGMRAIGAAFGIDKVFLPSYKGSDKQYRSAMAAVDELGVPAQSVSTKQDIELGGAHLVILPSSLTYIPDANGSEGNDNDLSLVVTLACGDDSYLFAGDLEKEGIEAYLKNGLGHFDVLKVPHHGEKSGNTDDFLEDVQPKIAIVTDSADDPAEKKTLKLLNGVGADTYCTSACGTVVVESSGTGNYSVSIDGD